MIPFLTIPGTWSYRDTWWHRDSPWPLYMREQGFVPLDDDGRPFVWTTRAVGWQFWRHWVGGSADILDWEVAGRNFYAYVVPPIAPERRVPPDSTFVYTHSHGLQPALIACSLGLKINTLVSVAGPVRKDMRAIAENARKNIGYWIQVHSDTSDRWQVFGGIGDGALGITRPHPLADWNVLLPKAGHSKILYDPAWFDRWMPILDVVRARYVPTSESNQVIVLRASPA